MTESPRCAKCKYGYLTSGDYCDCALGRELARVERNAPKPLKPLGCGKCTAGLIGADYCDCALGRYLARVERSPSAKYRV
jgi:hypothetical protein